MTLNTPPAPLQVTTVMTAEATLLCMYTGPHQLPLPLPIPHDKVHLSAEQQSSVRGICELRLRMWRAHEIAPSATRTQVVYALPVKAPARRGRNLRNSCKQFSLATVTQVTQLLKEVGVDLSTDVSATASGKPSEVAAET